AHRPPGRAPVHRPRPGPPDPDQPVPVPPAHERGARGGAPGDEAGGPRAALRGPGARRAGQGSRVRLCFVVQRYGLEATGGAETHCRWLAERLARSHEVQVVTTCALEYNEWRNHYPPGASTLEGIRVTRHPVERPRDPRAFALYSDIVFRDHHT